MCFVFTGKKEMGLLCIWANTKAISQSQVRNKAFDLLDYFIVDFHLYSCAHLLWLCVCVFVWDVFSRRLQMACATPIKLISSRHISHEITWKNCNCDQTELNEVKKNCLILMCMWILYTTLTHIVMQNERYKADRIEPLWRKMMQLVMFGSITWKANTNGS